MRKVLFRGKRADNGKWIVGSLLHVKVIPQGDCYLIFGPNFGWDDPGELHAKKHAVVAPETVGQYTGLRDKNNRRIFEGDIVRMYIGEGERSIAVYAMVQWHPNGPCLRDRETDIFVSFKDASFARDAPRIWEVIGNIYDNPELLGGDEDGQV